MNEIPKIMFFSSVSFILKTNKQQNVTKTPFEKSKTRKNSNGKASHHISHNKTDGIFIYFLYFVNDFIKQFNWSDSIIVSKYHNM